jgi:hypothetical protein
VKKSSAKTRKENMRIKIVKILTISSCLFFASLSGHSLIMQVPRAFAGDPQVQEKDLGSSPSVEASSPSMDPSTSSNYQKGGVFKVGRAFKTAGHSTKKGFSKVGHAFTWLGGKIKRTFTGEKEEKQTAQNTITQNPKSSNLDQVGESPENSSTDARN